MGNLYVYLFDNQIGLYCYYEFPDNVSIAFQALAYFSLLKFDVIIYRNAPVLTFRRNHFNNLTFLLIIYQAFFQKQSPGSWAHNRGNYPTLPRAISTVRIYGHYFETNDDIETLDGILISMHSNRGTPSTCTSGFGIMKVYKDVFEKKDHTLFRNT